AIARTAATWSASSDCRPQGPWSSSWSLARAGVGPLAPGTDVPGRAAMHHRSTLRRKIPRIAYRMAGSVSARTLVGQEVFRLARRWPHLAASRNTMSGSHTPPVQTERICDGHAATPSATRYGAVRYDRPPGAPA